MTGQDAVDLVHQAEAIALAAQARLAGLRRIEELRALDQGGCRPVDVARVVGRAGGGLAGLPRVLRRDHAQQRLRHLDQVAHREAGRLSHRKAVEERGVPPPEVHQVPAVLAVVEPRLAAREAGVGDPEARAGRAADDQLVAGDAMLEGLAVRRLHAERDLLEAHSSSRVSCVAIIASLTRKGPGRGAGVYWRGFSEPRLPRR